MATTEPKKELADQLDQEPRDPETRSIRITDELARSIAAALRGQKEPVVERCMLCNTPVPAGMVDPPAAYICEDCQSKSEH